MNEDTHILFLMIERGDTHRLLSMIEDEDTCILLSYFPTPPLGQDMTQGQFLSGV